MSETTTRAYQFHPIGGLTAPRGAPATRVACRRSGDGDVRVLIRGNACAIKVKRADGSTGAEEIVRREVAEALMKAFGDHTLQYHTVEFGDEWVVRIYEDALWGLVIGLYVGAGEPKAPDGWTLGSEVTDDPDFYMSALAALTSAGREAFVRRVTRTTAGA